MLFSQLTFDWVLTVIVLLLVTVWSFYDGRLLIRLLRDTEKRGDAGHNDKIFGSIVGLALCVIGLLGVLNFHLGFGW